MSKHHDKSVGPQFIMTSAQNTTPLPVAALQAVGTNVVHASQQMAAQVKPKTSLATKLMTGAIAGITGTIIIYPLDIVKTRLQNQSKQAVLEGTGYKGGVDCFRSIIRQEGVRGLYRGMPANLIGITPEKAIKLAVNDYAREFLAKKSNVEDADQLSIPLGMAAGGFAGFCQVVATNPMEIVKINSQMAGQIALKSGTTPKTSWEIVRELGVRGLYRGTPATLMRDVPFSFIFFPLSAFLKKQAADRDKAAGGTGKVSFQAVFWSGIGAGVVAAVSVTPADVIKTRLQTSGGVQYNGIADAARGILATDGTAAFFKGAKQRALIIAPLFGIATLVYEAQQRYFSSQSKK